MTGRFWFYLGSLVIVAGLYSWRTATVNSINNEVGRIEQASQQERVENITRYVATQTDERKLVSLAKQLKNSDQETLRIIIDRAYELNPGSRDITLLASEFHPELKTRVLELDPLYEGN
ncbi:MAG: hypothetical protein AAB669_00585 [Patescibacteria group bacterium]